MPSVPGALARSRGAAEPVGEALFDDMPELVDYESDDEPAPALTPQHEALPYGQWQSDFEDMLGMHFPDIRTATAEGEPEPLPEMPRPLAPSAELPAVVRHPSEFRYHWVVLLGDGTRWSNQIPTVSSMPVTAH